MKSVCLLVLLSVLAAWPAFPQTTSPQPPAGKKAAVKAQTRAETKAASKAPPKAAPKAGNSPAPAASPKTGTARKAVTKKSAKKAAPPAQTWRNRQSSPSAARYREIQQALADRGYFKSEPTGAWGAESEEALKQFQTERNLQATGKINSLSLIQLGLGPRPPEPITAPPNALPPNPSETAAPASGTPAPVPPRDTPTSPPQ